MDSEYWMYAAGGVVAALVLATVLVALVVRFRGRHVSAGGKQPYLYWDNDGYGKTYNLTRSTTRIGRHTSNDIVLPYKFISRFHAKLVKDRNGDFYIVDNHSSNHVYMNGKRVESDRLEEGAVVTLGHLPLRFRLRSPDADAGENLTTITSFDETACRRQGERKSAAVMVRYYNDKTGWRRGMAVNLGSNGMYIETNNKKLDEQDEVEVIVPTQSSGRLRWLRFMGKVVHHSERGIGIAFAGLDRESKRLLKDLDKAA